MRELRSYKTENGRLPFEEWISNVDRSHQKRIQKYLLRLLGPINQRNIKFLGEGVFECKIDIGPGYRVYFGRDGEQIVLILLGGDKDRQQRDIVKAKEYWSEYNEKIY